MGYPNQQRSDQGIAPSSSNDRQNADQYGRLIRAEAFLRELSHLPLGGNDYFNNTGKLTDMTRLLQVLTNTAYMEAKTHSMITKRGAEQLQIRSQSTMVASLTKNDGSAFSLNRLISADNKMMLEQSSKQKYDIIEADVDFDKL